MNKNEILKQVKFKSKQISDKIYTTVSSNSLKYFGCTGLVYIGFLTFLKIYPIKMFLVIGWSELFIFYSIVIIGGLLLSQFIDIIINFINSLLKNFK